MSHEPRGWAPLWRRIMRSKHWVGTSPPTKLVLVWLILHLRHRSTPRQPAGTVDAQISEIAAGTEVSEKSVSRALQELTRSGFCTVTRRAHGYRISVPTWQRWMVDSESSDRTQSPMTPDCQSDVSIHGSGEEDLLARVGADQRPPDLELGVPRGARGGSDSQSDRAKATEGYAETIDLFHRSYVTSYGGAKPTWGVAQGAQLKRLLRAHGAAEVQRRIGVLFSRPPSWLKPPHTFGTLVKHFDALVASSPADPRGGLSAGDLFALSDRMRGGGRRGGDGE